MRPTGFARVTAASHKTHVAGPIANAEEAIRFLESVPDSDVVVFGELSLTGYTCGDLFAQDQLLQQTIVALHQVAQSTRETQQVVIVGLPLRAVDRLYNVAAVLFDGQIVGMVPKQYLPNYQEFYESRWFHAGDGSEPASVQIDNAHNIPFGIDLLFQFGELKIGVEICEDLWMPVPPSSLQAAAGANLLCNLSASNELIGKADWRELLVRSQSGRCLAAYAYASAGPSESTTDVVFSGHCLVAENGSILASSERIGLDGCTWLEQSSATADIDLQHLSHDRRVTNSWQVAAKRATQSEFRVIPLKGEPASTGDARVIAPWPFVPSENAELHRRCSEIFGIQCAAFTKRISRLPKNLPLSIGVSGGLDSTLALLVAAKTFQNQQWPVERIVGITMPGFGTSDRTRSAAHKLMQHLKITTEEIDIRQLCLDTFLSLSHKPFGLEIEGLDLRQFNELLLKLPESSRNDLVFENVQARIRTMILMNRGFVIGTGDLSEQALGWSTYNGDHMSMYNVNTSIPKTLVRFLVRYVADNEFTGDIRECLHDIAAAPISPELLPLTSDGTVQQRTEDTIGSYELHDFFLYHFIRFGSSPERIIQLAQQAKFSKPYARDEIVKTLTTFLKRFFANQFKRSCVPDGPKVGSVSLSPRGDWRMPSDAEVSAWLAELDS